MLSDHELKSLRRIFKFLKSKFAFLEYTIIFCPAFLAEKFVAPIPVFKRGIQTVPGKCAHIQTLDNTAGSTEIPRDKKYPLWEIQQISPDKIILKWNTYYISVDSQGRLAARTDLRQEATIFHYTRYHSHKFSLR